ncbi:MAG: hypothetical protein JWQ80_1233 [Massilia sp.]|nr:hypothetical protein [Massilia sp.]
MAQSKRSDNVFLLTLVDFLLQIIFVGLFAYALVTAINTKRDATAMSIAKRLGNLDEAQLRKLLKALAELPDVGRALSDGREIKELLAKHGISNFVELDDTLSRMVPADQVAEVKQIHDVIRAAGGVEAAKKAVSYYVNGVGKPHCLYTDDKRNAVPLATLTAYDDHITIDGTTAELKKVLAEIGEDPAQVADMPLPAFTKVFSKLANRYPNCIHSVRFRENTNLVYARNAVSATRSLRLIFIRK